MNTENINDNNQVSLTDTIIACMTSYTDGNGNPFKARKHRVLPLLDTAKNYEFFFDLESQTVQVKHGDTARQIALPVLIYHVLNSIDATTDSFDSTFECLSIGAVNATHKMKLNKDLPETNHPFMQIPGVISVTKTPNSKKGELKILLENADNENLLAVYSAVLAIDNDYSFGQQIKEKIINELGMELDGKTTGFTVVKK